MHHCGDERCTTDAFSFSFPPSPFSCFSFVFLHRQFCTKPAEMSRLQAITRKFCPVRMGIHIFCFNLKLTKTFAISQQVQSAGALQSSASAEMAKPISRPSHSTGRGPTPFVEPCHEQEK